MTLHALQLRTLRVEDEEAFRAAVREFAALDPGWIFAFSYEDGMCFAEYVQRLERWAQGLDLPDGFVPNTFLVAVTDGVIVGRVSIRHTLNDWLARIGGHIGYGVVPSRRRRGYGTDMLRQALLIAADLGVDRALVTCNVDYAPSRRVIEKNGGVFDGLADDPGLKVPKRRYWIDTARSP